jgi:hypothetical protein
MAAAPGVITPGPRRSSKILSMLSISMIGVRVEGNQTW